jgi:hypothetical protein
MKTRTLLLVMQMLRTGDWIESAFVEGMTAPDAFQREPAATKRTVFVDGFHSVL